MKKIEMSIQPNNQIFANRWAYIPIQVDLSRPPPVTAVIATTYLNTSLPPPSALAISSNLPFPLNLTIPPPPPPTVAQLFSQHLTNSSAINSTPSCAPSTSSANKNVTTSSQKSKAKNESSSKPCNKYSIPPAKKLSRISVGVNSYLSQRSTSRNLSDYGDKRVGQYLKRKYDDSPRREKFEKRVEKNSSSQQHSVQSDRQCSSRAPTPVREETERPLKRSRQSRNSFSPNADANSSSSDSEKQKRLKTKEHQRTASNRENSEMKFSDYDGGNSTVSVTEEEDNVLGETEAKNYWIQTSHAKLYYKRDPDKMITGFRNTALLHKIQDNFETKVLNRCRHLRSTQPRLEPLALRPLVHRCNHHHAHDETSSEGSCSSEDEAKKPEIKNDAVGTKRTIKRRRRRDNGNVESDTSCSSDSENENQRFKTALEELKRKEEHPARLHRDLWFNEPNQMNDGPLCRCSWKAKQTGIAHSIYPGEKLIERCDPDSNNFDKLFHYRLDIYPLRNFSPRNPTSIKFDDHEYSFQGYSIFTHYPLPEKVPVCRVVRWNIEYTLTMIKEEAPENFVVRDLDMFWNYLFVELLEMYDADIVPSMLTTDEKVKGQSCPIFHVMPRFVRHLESNGLELLSMNNVLKYLTENYTPIFPSDQLTTVHEWSTEKWDRFVERLKGQLVTNPSKRPSTIRVDQIDRQSSSSNATTNTVDAVSGECVQQQQLESDISKPKQCDYPVLVHFGTRPAVLTYTGNPEYQRAWKQYVKFRHLLMMKPKLNPEDRAKLYQKELNLQRLKAKASLKRDVTVETSGEGFYRTGLQPDVVQHGLMMLVMFCHLRLHWALSVFEKERIKYSFKNRALLELALTHPSYRSNYGTNPDHARNTLSNSGIRQPEYGDKRSQQIYTRKRGINTLIDIMSRMGSKKVQQSPVANNERLEYLGDAVIEFLSTIHLYFMFPDLQEGGLATYRSSLVQNKHLAVLAKKLGLDDFMLFAHGPDLCHEADMKHAMANAFEAVMGALFLDGGVDVVDGVYGNALFLSKEEPELNYIWFHLPKHPLQEQEPEGDRHWVDEVEVLKKLTAFERQTGIEFKHVRLLARAFTRKNVGYNFLTLGHNQRLEFLGDTVLQLVTSEFLYKHFPEHHEGHLSLLRSCLVQNKTQSVICDDLGMTNFVVHPPAFLKTGPPELRMKDKADLVEAFLGALYVDRGLEACKTFCRVCLYPRLRYFITSQKWNDPKSQLQQCCLTIRNPDGGEPDIPVYKVICVEGPTNTRVYKVAVYFRAKRLATGLGHSVQEAEMKAAEEALDKCASLFPHLEKQKNFIERRFRNEFSSLDRRQQPQSMSTATVVARTATTKRRQLRNAKKRRRFQRPQFRNYRNNYNYASKQQQRPRMNYFSRTTDGAK